MHELAVTEALIGQVLSLCNERGVKKPGKIIAELGSLTNYKKDPILFYYGILKKEHPTLSGAKLVVREVKARVRCKSCGKERALEDNFLVRCPGCSSSEVKIIKGRDFIITEIVDGEKRCARNAGAAKNPKSRKKGRR